MSYTQDDLTLVKSAISELLEGKRVTKVSFSNGESVEYGMVSIDGLRARQAEIEAAIGISSGTYKPVRFVSGKGL